MQSSAKQLLSCLSPSAVCGVKNAAAAKSKSEATGLHLIRPQGATGGSLCIRIRSIRKRSAMLSAAVGSSDMTVPRW